MNRDPYSVLGVSRSATADEVKRAFHKLAHQHHPDKGGNAEKFKECSAAYAEINRCIASGFHQPSSHVTYEEAGVVDNAAWADLRKRAQKAGAEKPFDDFLTQVRKMKYEQAKQAGWKFNVQWNGREI